MATISRPPTASLSSLKIICAALCIGPSIFMILAFILGADDGGDLTAIAATVNIQRYVMLAMCVGVTIAAKIMGDRILYGVSSMRRGEGNFEARYVSSSIVRMALLEGVTLFSCVVLIQMPQALKQSDPLTYLHLIPLFLLFLQVIAVFPTDPKVTQARERFDSQNNG